jgi:hypothetical protein
MSILFERCQIHYRLFSFSVLSDKAEGRARHHPEGHGGLSYHGLVLPGRVKYQGRGSLQEY